MGANYISDREFTDYVHTNLALRDIYPKMDWVVDNVGKKMQENIDMNNAVDYMAVDGNRKIITIQERFRESKYSNYSDFTIRFERPENNHEERKKSEFYKLDANYFIYGIVDVLKYNMKNASKFLKCAVIDLEVVRQKLISGEIVIDRGMSGIFCKLKDGAIYCPVIKNKDDSSDFIPIDIIMLHKIAPDAIVYQLNYFND